MTDLQIKLMKWSNKILSKWCIIKINRWRIITIIDDPEIEVMMNHTRKLVYCFHKEYWSRSCRDIDVKDIEEIIWKPYSIGRLIGLNRTYNFEDKVQATKFNKMWTYMKENRLEDRECIYWPEEWQILVADFLDSLPKEHGTN